MGPLMSIALVIGTMVGAGIFFLPSSLAPLGWNSTLGWLISGAGALCLAMTFRYLMDGTGEGVQHNVERVIGEMPAFIGIFAYWIIGFTSISALSLMGGSILADLLFNTQSQQVSVTFALILLWALVGVNLRGVRSVGSVQVITVLIKLIPLVLVAGVFVGAVAGGADIQQMAPAEVNLNNISVAVALTLFPLLGFEAASIPVAKIRNPKRNIPLAMIGGPGLVLTLYILATTAMVLLVPWQDTAGSTSPFSDFLGGYFGPVTGTLMAVCILISVTGCNNGLILLGTECSYGMALRKEMPQLFARTNAYGISHWGVIAIGVGCTLLILANLSRGLTGMFEFLVLMTSGGALVFYLTGALAAVKENRKMARWPLLAIGILFIGYATYGTGLETSAWILVVLAFGLAMRWLCRRSAASEKMPAAG